uniref:Ig-like domain-containing protein n=1 Tax=Echeneis naucrates TaxID=173247 RepID=A0A665T9A6_ECHNA
MHLGLGFDYDFIFCLFIPVLSGEWKATVAKNLDALETSCVVLPCTFSHPKEALPSSKLRKLWHVSTNKGSFIYNEDPTLILENFRGRTRLLQESSTYNCTLEITDIKNHDNGPFCFRIELARTVNDQNTKDKFSFVDDCAQLNMISDPPKPSLVHTDTAREGHVYTITCSVTHTCPSHVPKLTWSKTTSDNIIESHRSMYTGLWEAQSILTFIPEEKDDHSDITCTAEFFGGKTSSSTKKLYIKRTGNYNHIIIPVVVGIGVFLIFGIFGIFIVKKYNHGKSQFCSNNEMFKPRFPSPKRYWSFVFRHTQHYCTFMADVNHFLCLIGTFNLNWSQPTQILQLQTGILHLPIIHHISKNCTQPLTISTSWTIIAIICHRNLTLVTITKTLQTSTSTETSKKRKLISACVASKQQT